MRPDAVLEFESCDSALVEGWMERLQANHQGWINLQPGVPDEVLERPVTSLSLFHRRPRELTLATWAAGPIRRGRAEGPTIGIQHGRPERARAVLQRSGQAIPPGWRALSDRPANGLVARPPEGAGHAEVLAWLLAATQIMSPVPVLGTWRALVHLGAGSGPAGQDACSGPAGLGAGPGPAGQDAGSDPAGEGP